MDVDNTYVETSNIADINYVSEGFLGRYRYTEKAKSTGLFKKLATMVAAVVVVAAAAVLTCGAGAVAMGVGLATALGSTLTTTAITASAVTVTATVGILGQAAYLKIRQKTAGAALLGRNTQVRKGYTRSELSDSRKLI
jgi:hypothetical protein